MECERLWHREPGWYSGLDEDGKARVLAWWNVLGIGLSPIGRVG